jgi:hypothetical protein
MKWMRISCRRPSKRSSSVASPSGPLEDVGLLDLDHRQPAALGVERVTAAGQLLSPGQQVLAGAQPRLA